LVYFSPYFYSNWGDGGQTGGEIWVYIEFIVARLPTLQIRVEQKVIPFLNRHTPLTNSTGIPQIVNTKQFVYNDERFKHSS
jgi:hypothetical protein